jgi:hypothetical protein
MSALKAWTIAMPMRSAQTHLAASIALVRLDLKELARHVLWRHATMHQVSRFWKHRLCYDSVQYQWS